MQVIAHELPPNFRRLQLSLNYALNLLSNHSNPTYYNTFQHLPSPLFRSKPHSIRPFSIRIKSALHKIIPVNSKIANIHISPVPPWTLRTPTVLFDLSKHNVKSFTNADTFNSHYHEIRNHFATYHSIFTDGSKTTNKTAAATFFQKSNICISHRLPKMFSIYSAELYAIKLALLHILEMHYHSHILFSDSMSSLQAIASKRIEYPIIFDIFIHYNNYLPKTTI